MQYDFPAGLRPTPVEEREEFYRKNFPEDEVRRIMKRWEYFVPVVDIGSESTLYKPRFRDMKGKLVRITEFEGIDELREKIVEYAPEDLYYGMTIEKEDAVEVNPQRELVFDLDPENIECRRCERRRKYMDERWRSYIFCLNCFGDIAEETRQLYYFLNTHFDHLQLVYSGRGFHIHVRDEAAFMMEREDRRGLASKVSEEFSIDPEITSGEVDLIRMPGSLHGMVSRKVTNLKVADLDDPEEIIRSKSVPDF